MAKKEQPWDPFVEWDWAPGIGLGPQEWDLDSEG